MKYCLGNDIAKALESVDRKIKVFVIYDLFKDGSYPISAVEFAEKKFPPPHKEDSPIIQYMFLCGIFPSKKVEYWKKKINFATVPMYNIHKAQKMGELLKMKLNDHIDDWLKKTWKTHTNQPLIKEKNKQNGL